MGLGTTFIAANSPCVSPSIAVGAPWVVDGIAGNPPAGTSTAQLVQAMAGFGGGSGATDSLNVTSLSADTSQQTLPCPGDGGRNGGGGNERDDGGGGYTTAPSGGSSSGFTREQIRRMQRTRKGRNGRIAMRHATKTTNIRPSIPRMRKKRGESWSTNKAGTAVTIARKVSPIQSSIFSIQSSQRFSRKHISEELGEEQDDDV
jgi:hypothetical protein